MSTGQHTASELETIRVRGYADPAYFCRLFLPHYFPEPLLWYQRGILAVTTGRTAFLCQYPDLDRILNEFTFKRGNDTLPIFIEESAGPGAPSALRLAPFPFTLVEIWRGAAKTSLAGVATSIWSICYGEIPYFNYISCSASQSTLQLGNVKRELDSNQSLIECFGDLKPTRSEAEVWRHDFIETRNGSAMLALGSGGQIRGQLWKGQRPSRIVGDDLEDKESVATEAQRAKMRSWFYGDVIPALGDKAQGANIVVLGTLLHADSLLQTLKRDPQWRVVKLRPIDSRGREAWPARFSAAELDRIRESHAAAGTMPEYWLEYWGEAIPDSARRFREDMFRFGPVERERLIALSIYCDPAISEGEGADDAVICVAGMEQGGQIVVCDMWGGRGQSPREIVDEYFRLAKAWRPQFHGVEANAFQAALVHLLREEMFSRQYFFEPIRVTHSRKANKATRINGILQPRFAAGYVRLARAFPKLQAQLLDFGVGGSHDDWPDALAGAVALLDPGAWAAAERAGEEGPRPSTLDAQGRLRPQYPPLARVLPRLAERRKWA